MNEFGGEAVDRAGFYFNESANQMVELDVGERLPDAPGEWEFIGGSSEMTPADAVAALQERHPEENIELKLIHKQGPGSGYEEMGEQCQVED